MIASCCKRPQSAADPGRRDLRDVGRRDHRGGAHRDAADEPEHRQLNSKNANPVPKLLAQAGDELVIVVR
jgi:hypothetical protein